MKNEDAGEIKERREGDVLYDSKEEEENGEVGGLTYGGGTNGGGGGIRE